MNINMIKLISIDLDGTTLNAYHKLSERNRIALQAAIAEGVKVVVNTGRHSTACKDIALEIGVNAPVISNNGARITDAYTDRLLYSCPLDAELIRAVALECAKKKWDAAASLDSVIYVDTMPPSCQKWIDEGYPVDVRVVGSQLTSGKQQADSMMVLVEEPEIYIAQDYLRGHFGDELHVAISMPPCIDVMNCGAGKGKTLTWLANQLGISRDEIMAIGDSFNDIDMLQAAAIGVAVDNAHPALKRIAKYSTAHHDEHGVAQAVEQYVLTPNK